ncbi:MAG: hypothetical protein ACLGIF_08465, partial [Actinomycetes bacterium]
MGLLVGGLGVVAACSVQARRAVGRRRARAWVLFALAAGVGTFGNVWLLVVGASMGPAAGLSPADVCLVLALLLGVAATITFPSAPRRPAEVVRIVLDGVVIGGSLLFFASILLFPQIVGPHADLASRALPLALPVIDVVVATTAFLLFLRRNAGDGGFLGLVSVGFVLFSVSDFAAAILTVDGPFSFGSLVDVGWVAGYVVIALGVLGAPRNVPPPAGRPQERSAVAGTALMFAVFVVAAVLNLGQHRDALGNASALLWLLVLLGVVGRQVSLIV